MLHSIVLCVFAARLSLDRHCSSFKIKTNKESDEKNSSITMKRSIKANTLPDKSRQICSLHERANFLPTKLELLIN